MDFLGADIVSAAQFSRGDIEAVLKMAKKMEPFSTKQKWGNLLEGKLVATLFYEPSTRTRMSFETSALRLGARVINAVGIQNSSLSKGETLYDTGKIIENYADVIVMRHPQTGSMEELARGSSVPVINAGDGSGEHPSQALLDIFTMQKEHGKIDGLKIAMVGDLKFGRTVHSLSSMLSHFNVELNFVSPQELRMPEPVCRTLKENNIKFTESTDMSEALKWCDVLYMTRIQQERFENEKEYEKHRGSYILTKEYIKERNSKAIIMHPFPRIWEITPDVDELPGAAYFKQAANGVAVRMALLALVLGKNP